MRISFGTYLVMAAFCCVVGFPIHLFMTSLSEREAKEYIMEHRSELNKTNTRYFPHDTVYSTHFKIEPVNHIYYTDATVVVNRDSSYRVIFWGNRDSKLWSFLKDLSFTVDIKYDRYKRKDVTNDVIIYRILKNK